MPIEPRAQRGRWFGQVFRLLLTSRPLAAIAGEPSVLLRDCR